MTWPKKHSYFGRKTIICCAYVLFFTACSDGVQKNYDQNGQLASVLRYDSNGKLHGKCTWFYPDGHMQLEATYLHGIANGLQIRYHENGMPQESTRFENGLKDSISTFYNMQGQATIKESWLRDTLHGPYERWYETGALAIQGNYFKGMMDGIWLFFDQEGTIIGKGDFKMGNGVQKILHPNGQLHRSIPYQQNLKHGREEIYTPDGKLLQTIQYQNGIPQNGPLQISPAN